MAIGNIESKISELIATDLSAMGFDLVRVQMTGGNSNAVLQIMAEYTESDTVPKGTPVQAMTVEDCAAISRAVSDKLDATNLIAGEYNLEVSSPGIDRPLIRVKDYTRHAGYLAVVELHAPLAGRRRFKGKISAVAMKTSNDAEIEFATDDGEIRVPMASIAKAKLVLTDELLKQAAKAVK